MNRNYDSPVNEIIKKKLVDREVYACITDMAGNLFDFEGDAYASYDEFENMYVTTCPECGARNSFEHDVRDNNELSDYWFCDKCGHEVDEELETEIQEIYEYWIVSPWFGQKLKDAGESVFKRRNGWIWGRTVTGQAISSDYVIGYICEGMEILEDMRNEWNTK